MLETLSWLWRPELFALSLILACVFVGLHLLFYNDDDEGE